MPSAAHNNSFNPTLASESFIIKVVWFLVCCRYRAGFGRVNSGVRFLPFIEAKVLI
jgi:hypothetical protein